MLKTSQIHEPPQIDEVPEPPGISEEYFYPESHDENIPPEDAPLPPIHPETIKFQYVSQDIYIVIVMEWIQIRKTIYGWLMIILLFMHLPLVTNSIISDKEQIKSSFLGMEEVLELQLFIHRENSIQWERKGQILMFTSMLVKITDCTEYLGKVLNGHFLIPAFLRMGRNSSQWDLLQTIRFAFGIGNRKQFS